MEIITGLITQQLLWRKYNQKYLKVTIRAILPLHPRPPSPTSTHIFYAEWRVERTRVWLTGSLHCPGGLERLAAQCQGRGRAVQAARRDVQVSNLLHELCDLQVRRPLAGPACAWRPRAWQISQPKGHHLDHHLSHMCACTGLTIAPPQRGLGTVEGFARAAAKRRGGGPMREHLGRVRDARQLDQVDRLMN